MNSSLVFFFFAFTQVDGFDKVVFDVAKEPPVQLVLGETPLYNKWEEAISLMHVGDTCDITIPANVAFANQKEKLVTDAVAVRTSDATGVTAEALVKDEATGVNMRVRAHSLPPVKTDIYLRVRLRSAPQEMPAFKLPF